MRDIWGKSTSLSFHSFRIIRAAETLDISKCCDRLYSVSNLIETSGPHTHALREISDIVTSSGWVTSWDDVACERCVCGIELHIFPPHLKVGRRSKIWCVKVTRFTLQLPSAPSALSDEKSVQSWMLSHRCLRGRKKREMRTRDMTHNSLSCVVLNVKAGSKMRGRV